MLIILLNILYFSSYIM